MRGVAADQTRLREKIQPRQILANDVQAVWVAINERRERRALRQRFDAHRSGARVEIQKLTTAGPKPQDVEQRFFDTAQNRANTLSWRRRFE